MKSPNLTKFPKHPAGTLGLTHPPEPKLPPSSESLEFWLQHLLRHDGEVDRWQTPFGGLVSFLPGIWPERVRVSSAGLRIRVLKRVGGDFRACEVQLRIRT